MAFRSSAKANATSGSVTATPPSVVAGDLLIAHFNHDSGSNPTPSGWTLIDSDTYFPDGQVGAIYYRVATGTDSFTFSSDTGFGMALTVSAYSGRDTSSPFSATAVKTVNSSNNSSPVSVSMSGITASAGDDIVVVCGGDQPSDVARWSASTISSYTLRQNQVNEDYCSAITLQTRDNVSAGATGSLAFTFTRTGGSDGLGYLGWVLALKAGAGGITATASDSVSLSDSAASVTNRICAANDTVSLSDSAVSITNRVSLASDTLTLSDSAVSVTTRLSVATDSLSLSDSAVASRTGRTVVATDSVSLADSAISVSQRVSDASDTISFADSAISVSQRTSDATDGISLSDSGVAVKQTAGVSVASDTISFGDSAISVSQRIATAFDTIVLSDSAVRIPNSGGGANYGYRDSRRRGIIIPIYGRG